VIRALAAGAAGRLANVVFGGAGTLGLGQAPAFMDQYQQRLGGRLDQAIETVERIRADALARGETLEQYIALSLADSSSRAQDAGRRAQEAVESLDGLRAAYAELSFAEPLGRPLVFARHLDTDIANATLRDFTPALPLTAEALAYGLLGLVLGLGLLSLLQAAGRAGLRARKTSTS
jgi:hypothetical protein